MDDLAAIGQFCC